MSRIIFFILAISLFIIGFEIVLTGGVWNKYHDFYTDFGKYKYIFGTGAFLVALYFLFYAVFGKWKKTTTYICPKCEETLKDIEGKDISCPKCGTKMEPLKGFYERHPELKGKS